jgi:peptide deformylase
MILSIVKYGDPVLRKKGAKVEAITRDIEKLIADMKETMYDAKGVGLAAQQIGQALQLAVVDVAGITDRPSTLSIHGEPATVDDFMPVVLINPEVTPAAEPVIGSEGCLSFPEMYGEIARPALIDVVATNEFGKTTKFRCGGLLARAIQHELDHLNGILFIDRMDPAAKRELKPELDELQAATKAELAKRQKRKS